MMIIDQGEQDILNIGSEGVASALPIKDEITSNQSTGLVWASRRMIFPPSALSERSDPHV